VNRLCCIDGGCERYVAASRARHHLVLLFTRQLSDSALATLTDLAGDDNVFGIDFADEDPNRPIGHDTAAEPRKDPAA
jgi:hypothetical protein